MSGESNLHVEGTITSPEANAREHAWSSDRFDVLDAIRGCAALSIFVFHYFALWPGAFPDGWEKLRGLIGNYAGMGVPVFYALSGLSLCLGFSERAARAGFVREFYVKRFFRIAPLFYAALAAWILIVLSRGAPIDVPKAVLSASFLFNLLPGMHDSYVGAGWSIGVEMLFYLVFPVVVLVVRDWRSGALALVVASAFAIYSYRQLSLTVGSDFAGMSVASHLHYFVAGIAAYFFARRFASAAWRRAAGVGLVVIAALLVWILTRDAFWRLTPHVDGSVIRVLWAYPICLALVGACLLKPQNRWVRGLATVGHWSYSLYLLHPILLYFVFEAFRRQTLFTGGSGLGFFVLFILVGCVLIALSRGTFMKFERPFIFLGRRLAQAGGTVQPWEDARFTVPFSSTRYCVVCLAVLTLACGSFHFYQSTRYWDHTIAGHHGFRQGQTALTTQMIVREGFKFAYETPVFGPPWSIPMEFPVYQLIVAGASRLTETPLEQVGRAVSLSFFYLSVGACWWLLSSVGVNLAGRLAACCFLFVAPLYVFWSRAFLIESTGLFFSLCFAASTVAWLKNGPRSRILVGIAVLAGGVAALSKVTTFSVSLGFVLLYALHQGTTRSIAWRRVGVALAVCASSLTIGYLWVRYSDEVKAAQGTPMAEVILSPNLKAFNFGTIAQRLRSEFWDRMHLHGVSFVTFSLWPWLLLLAGLATARMRFTTLILLAAFISGPLVFANLYFVHDYYWYANTAYLLAALGLGVGCLFQAGALGRVLSVVVVAGCAAMGVSRYTTTPYQTYQSANELSLQQLGTRIAEVTSERDVVMMVGFDWDSSLAFFSGRRAIMPFVPQFEVHPATLRAVQRLPFEGRSLALLAVTTMQKSKIESMRRLQTAYGFAEIPLYEDSEYALYPMRADQVQRGSPLSISKDMVLVRASAAIPVQPMRVDGQTVWLAHAPGVLEFLTPDFPSRLQFRYGLDPRAYAGDLATDGVEFVVNVGDGAAAAVIWTRMLRPSSEPGDRGSQEATPMYVFPPRTRILLKVGTGGLSGTWDWSYWADIRAIRVDS